MRHVLSLSARILVSPISEPERALYGYPSGAWIARFVDGPNVRTWGVDMGAAAQHAANYLLTLAKQDSIIRTMTDYCPALIEPWEALASAGDQQAARIRVMLDVSPLP